MRVVGKKTIPVIKSIKVLEPPSSGKGYKTAGVITLVLVADDEKVVGIVDDVLTPFVWLVP